MMEGVRSEPKRPGWEASRRERGAPLDQLEAWRDNALAGAGGRADDRCQRRTKRGTGAGLATGSRLGQLLRALQGELTRLGIPPGCSFVEEPQTNVAVERFNRALKEQANYGRVFRILDEVRKAVLSLRLEYNRSWRLKKLGFLTPREARQR